MKIDLSLLHSKIKNEIDISGVYNIPSDYIENTDIIKLDEVKVSGIITQDEEDNDIIKCVIKGNMTINDSISYEEIEYPYEIEYDDYISESLKKSENILDILGFLWENIVLEVPLQFTKVEDLSKFHGDGWKLISEDELKKENNPFSDLYKYLDKE